MAVIMETEERNHKVSGNDKADRTLQNHLMVFLLV